MDPVLVAGVLVVLGIASGIFIVTYNGLMTAKTRVVQGWSGIEVQLRRRHDLVPGLVSALRSALGHESAMIEKVTQSRERALAALASHDPQTIAHEEAELSGALKGLMGYAESFPDLKVTTNIETFQRQLEETEDQIAAARRLYNGNVQDLNRRILGIPGNVIAPIAGVTAATSFTLEPAERNAVYRAPAIEI